MKKSIVVFCIITALLFQCFPIFGASIKISEDFESYTAYVDGKWYGQGNGNIPIVSTDRGKSACITATSNKMSELIHPFTELGTSVKSLKTSYSIYFEDNRSRRSFYVRDIKQGEFPLFSFEENSNRIILTGGVSDNEFTYECGVWYDITVQFNIAEGLVKIDITDGKRSAELYGFASKMETWYIHRIDFVSFASKGDESVCYVDDISLTTCEPFVPKIYSVSGGLYETFDYASVDNNRVGRFDVLSSNDLSTVILDEKLEGRAVRLCANGGYAGISTSTEFLTSDAFRLDFMINKISLTSKAEIYLSENGNKHSLITIEKNYAMLPGGQKLTIPTDSYARLSLHTEISSGKMLLNCEDITIECVTSNITLPESIVFCAMSDSGISEVLMDNILCFPADIMDDDISRTVPEFYDREYLLINENFDTCGSKIPNDFKTQVTPENDTSSSAYVETIIDGGSLCMENGDAIFEVIKPMTSVSPAILNISWSVMLPDTNSAKAMFIRTPDYGEMRIMVFDINNTVRVGETVISVDVFSFKTDVVYDVSLQYNLVSGDIQALVSDDTSTYTLNGKYKGNVTEVYRVYFVSFASKSEKTVIYIDNFSVSASDISYPMVYTESSLNDTWLDSSVPANGDTAVVSDTKQIVLTFKSAPKQGIYLINGTDNLIKSVSYINNDVVLELYGLSKNSDYVLSYSTVILENEDVAHGRIVFATAGRVSISDIEFKDINGKTSAMNKDGTACWFTASSSEPCRINVYASLYDSIDKRLININTKTFNITSVVREYDMHIDVPCDISRYTMKIIVTDDRLTPLKLVTYSLPFTRLNGDEIMADFEAHTPHGTHPRLVTNRNRINQIRANITFNADFSQAYRSLLIKANDYLKTEPRGYEIPDGKRLLSVAQEIRTRIETLGLVYQITGDEKYAARLYAELENAALFPDWNPRHFLDCATMLSSFGLGYDYAYDYITADDSRKDTVVGAVAKLGFEPLLDDYLDCPRDRTYKWTLTNEPDNWNVVCNSGAILAALSFTEELPQYAKTVFQHAFPLLEKAAVRFGPDGAWFEGPSYWSYTLNYYVDILTSLKNCLGTDYGFSQVPGLDRTGYYIHMISGSGGVFNFSNSSAGKIAGTELFALANALNDKDLETLQYSYMKANDIALDYKGILNYRGNFEEGTIQLPEDSYFRDTEVVALRSGYDIQDTFVGFCAGENFVPHAHLDIGSFVLDMMGQRFICDLGSENYNISGSTWNLYRNRAEGHNTVVINPDNNPDQNTGASSVIDRFYTSDTHSFVVCDMTDAYSDNAASAIRGICLTEDKSVVLVQDEIKCLQPSEIWWFMHTDAMVTLSADGKRAILTKSGKSIVAQIVSDYGTFSIMDALPMSTSPQNNLQNKNAGYRKLAVNLKDVTDVTFAVMFMPVDYIHSQTDIISLKNWK